MSFDFLKTDIEKSYISVLEIVIKNKIFTSKTVWFIRNKRITLFEFKINKIFDFKNRFGLFKNKNIILLFINLKNY
jgi:hypothetical protein